MPYRLLLTRIKKLFRAGAGPYFKSVEDGFKSRRLKLPAQPMTDPELARAIREFQAKAGLRLDTPEARRRFEGT